MTTAETSSATAILRHDSLPAMAEALSKAAHKTRPLQLVMDSTGEMPVITLWHGNECLGAFEAAGVVFE
jgi:hypothetical protein